jgi:hypothetical protein
MPSNKPQLKAYVDATTYEKFKTLANKEHRSTSNYIEMLISKEIEQYENKHGNIKINMLKNDGKIDTVNM